MKAISSIYLLLATALLGGGEPDPATRPVKVGRFGNPQALRIEGDKTFSPDEIRSALARSSSFVLNSHPGAPFDKLPESIEQSLLRGYKSCGFPRPLVEVEWNGADDEVVIQVEEGPRFKAGDVRVTGAQAIREEQIRWWLIDSERDGQKVDFDERSEKVFHRYGPEKELPWEAALRIFGDHAAVLQNQAAQGGGFLELAADEPAAPWFPGKWINFTEMARASITTVVRRAYMEEGYQFMEFEVDFVEGKREGVMDLAVKIVEESPLTLLGEVVVAGNVINSDEAILRYLGLEKGMELKGAYEVALRRRLWESGRFAGWKVVSWRPPLEAVIQLSICVAEHWEAAPLEAPLTRAQKALLKLAGWVNAYDGRSGDLVVSAGEGPQGWGELELAADMDGGLIMMVNAGGLSVAVESVPGGLLSLILQGPAGKFHAAVPVDDSNLVAYLSILEGFAPADPAGVNDVGNAAASQFKSASISFGAGMGTSVDRSTTIIGLDPAAAFRVTGSQDGADEVTFADGMVAVTQGDLVLRFEEETGRLLSVTSDGEAGSLRLAIESDGFARLHGKLAAGAAGVPNSMQDQSAWTMVAASMGMVKELWDGVQTVEDFDDPDQVYGLFEDGALRARNWLPMARTLGEALDSILGDEKEDDEKADVFGIPTDLKLLAGMNLMTMIGAAVYDELAAMVEPGTWPDLVLRETLFHLYGNSQYMDETVEMLYRDEAMGPLGCLICAELLHRAGHHAARRFIEKAKGELSVSGFEKDWTLVLRGRPDEGGAGWRVAAMLAKLRIEDLEVALAGSPPGLRRELEAVLKAFQELGGGTSARDMAPAMERLWDAGGGDLVRRMVARVENRITPKANPAVMALVVNGVPVPRVAARVDEWVGRARLEADFEEEWINQVLFAQQIWELGKSAGKAQVEGIRKKLIVGLGGGDEKKGWEKARADGMNEEYLDWSLGVLMASAHYASEFLGKEEIAEEEVRAFYERRPDLFGAALETHVHRIMIPKTGEGLDPEDQVILAKAIRERIKAAPDLKAQVTVFNEEAKAHSVSPEAENGGCCRWLVPGDWYKEDLAMAIALVSGPGLSKVIDDGRFLYVIQIPEKRRMGKSNPFEMVADKARNWALMDRAAKRLRKRADIVRLDVPADGEVYEEPEPEKGVAEVAGKMMDLMTPAEGEKKGDDEKPVQGLRSELERVQEQAAGGDGRFLYFLGTYHERGVGMPRDLDAARTCYEKAAAAGERRAMLRLAHLYFTGQGVERDEGKARKWRDAAKLE